MDSVYIIFYPDGGVFAVTDSLETAENEAERLGGSHLQVSLV